MGLFNKKDFRTAVRRPSSLGLNRFFSRDLLQSRIEYFSAVLLFCDELQLFGSSQGGALAKSNVILTPVSIENSQKISKECQSKMIL